MKAFFALVATAAAGAVAAAPVCLASSAGCQPAECCQTIVLNAVRGEIGADQQRFAELVCRDGNLPAASRDFCRDVALAGMLLGTRVSHGALGCDVRIHRLGAEGAVLLWTS